MTMMQWPAASERSIATMAHLRDPKVGDRYSEMLSAWMHVVARIGPIVVVHFLNNVNGELKLYESVEAFVEANTYSTNKEASPWTYYDNIGERVVDYMHGEYLKR